MLGWSVAAAAALIPTLNAHTPSDDEAGCLPALVMSILFVMIGCARGRTEAMSLSPRRCTRRPLTVRLVVQLVCVASFAAAATGSFYLNGSFTYTSKESGETVTYTGPEALRAAWEGLGELSADVSVSVQRLWAMQQGKTWTQVWEAVRSAFRDPSYEAAEVLGITPDASVSQIKTAHRRLALQHHPDKVGEDERTQEEAKKYMQRINWAKETLMGRAAN